MARNLYSALTEGGWLAVSPSEASQTLFAAHRNAFQDGAVLYQKECRASPSRKDPNAIDFGWAPDFQGLPPAVDESSVDRLQGGWGAPDYEASESPAPSEVADIHEGETDRLIPAGAPPLAEPRREQAQGLYLEGRYREAEEELLAFLAEDPDDPQAWTLLARTLANLGRLVEALDACDRAILAEKLDPATHYLKAMILGEQSRLEEAIAALHRAVYLEPGFVLAHFSLGNLIHRSGRPFEAQRHWRNALESMAECRADETPPGSEGMTVGTLTEILHLLVEREGVA